MEFIKWLTEQWNWLKSFFSEPDGKASVKRLIGFWTIAAFLFSYVRIALATQELLDMPSNWSIMILAILGLGIVDKIASNGKKKDG